MLTIFVLAVMINFSNSQENPVNTILENATNDEEEILKAIVLYPDDIIDNVLVIANEPVVLSRIGLMQQRSSKRFMDIIDGIDGDAQAGIWDITRYPELVGALVNNNISALNSYPKDIKEEALVLVEDYEYELNRIYELQMDNEDELAEILYPLNDEKQEAFRSLIELPEVFSLMCENLDLTILIGDSWKKDPISMQIRIDSLKVLVAEENTRELAEWKSQIEANPNIVEELKGLTQEYTGIDNKDDSYADDLYAQYDDEVYHGEEEDYTTKEIYEHYHYPYWYGYPYWYEFPRWRPYPIWYDWGFYWSSPSRVVVISLPSSYFVHWYFRHPMHFRWYPHITNRFIDHHYAHRSHGSSIYAGVNTWKRNNGTLIKESWLKNKAVRNEYLREFSEVEQQRLRYNEKNQNQQLSQKEYISRFASRYKKINDASRIKEKKVVSPRKTLDTKTSQRKLNDIYKKPPSKKITKDNLKKIKRGNDYHSLKWTKPKISPRKNSKIVPAKKKSTSRKKING